MVILQAQASQVVNGRCDHHHHHPDDGSVSSTLTVDRVNGKVALQNQLGSGTTSTKAGGRCRRRGVSFDMTRNVFYDNNRAPVCWEEEDLEELWFRDGDFRRFKKQSIAAAREIIQVEKMNESTSSYIRVVARTYKACIEQAATRKSSTSIRDDDDAGVVVVLEERERDRLERWMQIAPSRIGLEKWSVRSMAACRKKSREEILREVLGHQREDQDACSSSSASNSSDPAERLRRKSERVSLPSKMFAREMARAAAAAATGMKA